MSEEKAETTQRHPTDRVADGILLTIFVVWPTLFLTLLWNVVNQ